MLLVRQSPAGLHHEWKEKPGALLDAFSELFAWCCRGRVPEFSRVLLSVRGGF